MPLLDFDYRDPKAISAVSLTLDSPLEPIVGYAKGISGFVRFDPSRPRSATGRLAVDVSSVQFANDGYTATARGYALNEKRWPQITLAIRKVERVREVAKDRYEGVVLADFTCRGVTRPKRLDVVATFLPGRAEERTNGQHKGDLLVLRTRFTVSRREHGMSVGIPDSMVGDRIEVGVAVVGTHYATPPPEARWEVEFGDRDDPKLLQVERTGERLTLRSGAESIGATRVGERGFRLDPNPAYGQATGEFDARGNGLLRTKEGTVVLRGRLVTAFAARPALSPKGRGFESLDLPRRMREAGTAGLAVVRIEDDGAPEIGTYGVRQAGDTERVGEATTFQAGTMGTPVLHATALRLAAAGRLDLDRRVNEMLGEAAIPAGPQGWGERVTVRDLMRGTSGFAFIKSGGDAPDAPPTPFTVPAPEVQPGTTEGVSAANEALLERVVARAGGKPAPEVVAEEVFHPLGMVDSAYGPPPKGAARGHYALGEPTLDPYHLYVDALGNELWTSPRDFGRFLAEVGRLIDGKPNLLLNAPSLLAQVDAPKSVLGIRKGDDGLRYLGGDPYGFYCEFAMRPRKTRLGKRETILVMQNRMMAWRLSNEIRDALRMVPLLRPVPVEAAAKPLPRVGGGEPLSLDAIRSGRNLVAVFLNEQCGVTVYYKARLQRLVKDFGPKGFAFVAVRTGRKQFSDRPVDLPERAYLKVPFLEDEEGALMRRYGIGQSLTFAVLDKGGRLRYLGGLDDAVDERAVRKTPLRDALRALAAGKAIKIARAPAIGCAILPVER